ncbi:MAG: hypothetical protein AAGF95_01240 [Chloroflexota bacterium]
MSGKLFRQLARAIHTVGSVVIATYIYSSWSSDPVFTMMVQFVTIPLLALTGIAMWQQSRLLKLFQRNKKVLR